MPLDRATVPARLVAFPIAGDAVAVAGQSIPGASIVGTVNADAPTADGHVSVYQLEVNDGLEAAVERCTVALDAEKAFREECSGGRFASSFFYISRSPVS
jgi:hypothetical protein